MERVRKQVQSYSHLELKLIFCVVVLTLVGFVLLICLLVINKEGGVCYTPECINAAHHIINTIDDSVDPCDDFYKFSCGNFLKDAIAKDLMSPLKSLDDKKKSALRQIVMEDRESEENLSKSFRDQRKFYRTCMNTTAIEEDGDKAFLETLKYVTGGWPLSRGYTEDLQWPQIMVKARERGLKFDFFLDVDIKNNYTAREVYLEVRPPPFENFDEHLWREANLQKIMEMAEYWGDPTLSATWELRKTIEFAKNLNQIVEKAHNETTNLTLEEQKTTISKLKNLAFLKLDWLQFFKNMTNLPNLREDQVVLFRVGEEYTKNLYYLLQKTQIKLWTNYIVLLFIKDDFMYLSNKIRKICKEIGGPSRFPNRREFCFDQSTIIFSGVAEAEYTRQVITKEKREHIREIIKGVKWELEQSLKTNKFMDEKSRDQAVKHLKNVTEAIGWTDIVFNETEFDKTFGYDKLNLMSDNIIELSQQLTKFYFDFRFSKVGKTIGNFFETSLITPLMEVNAFYVTVMNTLLLSSPILHPPVYDINRPEYMNYGALGSIIGHELTHALTDHNETWNQRSVKFWNNTNEDYLKSLQCIIEDYQNYTKSINGKIENGTKTLTENMADFTGLNLAYRAYQKWVDQHGTEHQLPGIQFTPNQIFWIMASTFMCLEPKLMEPHMEHTQTRYAVANFRVIGPISNSPYFAQDFGCSEGTRMNPKKKCVLFE